MRPTGPWHRIPCMPSSPTQRPTRTSRSNSSTRAASATTSKCTNTTSPPRGRSRVAMHRSRWAPCYAAVPCAQCAARSTTFRIAGMRSSRRQPRGTAHCVGTATPITHRVYAHRCPSAWVDRFVVACAAPIDRELATHLQILVPTADAINTIHHFLIVYDCVSE